MPSHQAVTAYYSFLVVSVIVFPLWWVTTRSYRATLPVQEIVSLQQTDIEVGASVSIFISPDLLTKLDEDVHRSIAKMNYELQQNFAESGSSCNAVKVNFSVEVLPRSKLKELNTLRDNRFIPSCVGLEMDHTNPSGRQYKYNVYVLEKYESDLQDSQAEVCSTETLTDFGIVMGCDLLDHKETSLAVASSFINTYLNTVCDTSSQLNVSKPELQKPTGYMNRIKPGEHIISVTLAIADPHAINVTWDTEGMLDSYFKKYRSHIQPLVTLNVQSQVHYFADFETKKRKNGSGYYLPKDFLPLMINPLESRFNNYVTKSNILHYVVYIPLLDESPLMIEGGSDRFLVEGWGGLWIHNKAAENVLTNSTHIVSSLELAEVFLPMINQHFGIGVSNLSHNCAPDSIPSHIILKRAMSASIDLQQSTISALMSLSKLMNDIENMVIKDEIRDLVVNSVHHLQLSRKSLKDGDIINGLKLAKKAFQFSEKAFYDPSLLALLYFPSDEKYAIYIPLFLPVSLPLFVSLYKSIRLHFANNRPSR